MKTFLPPPFALRDAPPLPARRRMLLALPSSALLASPLALVGCGGGGGGDADVGSTGPGADVVLALPRGVDARAVTVVSGSAELAAADRLALPLPDGAPSLVSAVHTSERLLAIGMMAAGTSGQTLGARSSAEALLFLSLGGGLLAGADRTQLLQAVRADPAAATLAAVIEQRWTSDPFALDGPDAQIVTALRGATAAMRAGPASAAGTNAGPAADNQAGGDGRRRALALPPLQRIEPSTALAGVTLLQADAADGEPGIRLQNTKRRAGTAQVYETAYKPEDGARTELGLARVQYARIDLPATRALSVFSAISQLASGPVPWSPVETARFGLPMHAGAEETTYETVCLTPVWDRPEPAFFAELRYSLARNEWRDELKRLYTTAQMELVLGAILEALGVGGGVIASAQLEQAIAAMRAAASATPGVFELLEQAGGGRALLAGWRAWLLNVVDVNSGRALVSGAYRAGVATLVRQANAQLAANIEAANLSAARMAAFRAGIRLLLGAVVITGVVDTVAQYRDLHEGDPALLFTSTLVAPRVQVSPASARLQRNGELPLTARLTGAPSLTPRWRWSLSGGNGLASLRDSRNQSGLAFETADATVTLATTPSSLGPLTVTVEAIVDRNGNPESAGSARSVIEIDETMVTLSPTAARVPRTGGSRSFTLTVNPSRPDLQVEWRCDSRYGSLEAGGQTTSGTRPAITGTALSSTYTGRSDNDGGTWETITAVAFVVESAQRRDLGTASVEVFIEQEFNLVLTPSGGELPVDSSIGMTASFREAPPPGSTVRWTWSHGGVGSLAPRSAAAGATADLATGPTEGTATVTAQATVRLPDGREVTPLPVTVALGVKRGLRTLTLQGGWTIETVYTPYVCGRCGPGATDLNLISADVTAYVVVPRVAGARSYSARLEKPTPDVPRGVPFPSTRTVNPNNLGSTWQDRGGSYWSMLSSASGAVGPGVPGDAIAWFQSRFGDMSVTVTVTL